MKILLPLLTLALAGAAMAEEPAKTEPQKPRPALNLRLDDGNSAAPRINFDQPASTQTKEQREKGLPELGGKPSTAYDRTLGSGTNAATSNGVIPSAMDPSVNRP
jgi:hypothetical protein